MAALHQAAESHKMAQQAINALQTQVRAYQHMQQIVEQVQVRMDTLEAILKDSVDGPALASKRAGPAQQDPDPEAEPLSKKLRALRWKVNGK